ncbi:L-aspartate oxidase [Fusobacterium sp.]|uniref:L-aspartate oxidase n=2 Tax=Fusobacterium sp. TaxID=68766 RepID=UPI002633BDB1|nr:L-aspartate oxidase [Fusobacterium sp.]
MNMKNYDVIIVGTGVGGCFTALHLPEDKKVLMITKSQLEESDSFLAQGGICVLRDENDFDSFFEDTLRAGHYKNKKESVEIMINSSRETIDELIKFGVDFENKDGELLYTREGAHSKPRILYHEDVTGKEITQKLLAQVKKRKNIEILEYTTMVDIITKENKCIGVVIKKDEEITPVFAENIVLATGGIGGIYENSTNFPHLTGDSLAICKNHGVKLKDISYIQIHPTSLYSKKPGRKFLVSESVRGEGALLYDKNFERFTDELIPRDKLTEKINAQMKKDNTNFVWLDMREIIKKGIDIEKRFPNIIKKCREEGYEPTKECIPVVPAQHYFMGGIDVDSNSQTSMKNLYAVGETSCNGVHGANRLASNSLLESLVFAKRVADHINSKNEKNEMAVEEIDLEKYKNLTKLFQDYKNLIFKEIEEDKIRKGEENE